MRMDMPGVQVSADDIFILPTQHAVCQFLCDLVRKFRRHFAGGKALHKVVCAISLPTRPRRLLTVA